MDNMIKAIFSASPTNMTMAQALQWDYNPSLISIPVFFVSSMGNGDENLVVSGTQLQEIFHLKNHKGENESMQEQTRTPVFQNSDGTWGHLTKTINPLICTIEYGSSTRFSSKEEAEKSYQKSMDSYQDLLSMLKKTRNVPFTFSEYLDYWIKEIQALRRITIARSNEKNVKDRRNHFF